MRINMWNSIALKKILSFALSIALLFSLFATISPIGANAAMPIPATGDPSHGVDYDEIFASGNGIYFGAYMHANEKRYNNRASKDSAATPVLWLPMGEDSNNGLMTMMSKYALDNNRFMFTVNNPYEDSFMKAWLNSSGIGDFLENDPFLSTELGAIVKSTVQCRKYDNATGTPLLGTSYGGTYDADGLAISPSPTPSYFYIPWGTYADSWPDGNNNKIGWDDSAEKSSNNTLDQSEKIYTTKNGIPVAYSLRSPSSHENFTLQVSEEGDVQLHSRTYGYVRPLYKLDPNKIIFSSLIRASGADSTRGETPSDDINYSAGTAGAKNYKLTMLNIGLSISDLQYGSTEISGNPTITTNTLGDHLDLTGTGSAGTKLTYKIVDSSNAIVGYGQGVDHTAVTVNAVANVTDGGNLAEGSYTVYVWAQKENAIHSHEGSQPQHFTLLVDLLPTIADIAPNTQSEELSGSVAITFDETMNPSVTGTVSLDNGIGNLAGGTWSNSNMTYTIPYSGLDYDTTYTISISGFANAIGDVMIADNSRTFKTRTMIQIATPTANPAGSAVAIGTHVTLDCNELDATIHYTTDGTEPTASSAVYSSPITVNSVVNIKAIAVKTGMTDSAVMSESYTILAVPPANTSPTITGPTSMSLPQGYSATSTDAYAVTGTAPVTVSKTSGDAVITWNSVTSKLDIAPGLGEGTYPVELTATNGTAPDATFTFTLTVTAGAVTPPTTSPTITGPTSMSLPQGYSATSTDAYAVTGTAPVTVSKTSGDAVITWNSVTSKLDIAPGLGEGTYPVELTATNGTAPDATFTFTLTVTAGAVTPPVVTPPTITTSDRGSSNGGTDKADGSPILMAQTGTYWLTDSDVKGAIAAPGAYQRFCRNPAGPFEADRCNWAWLQTPDYK